jgi:UDP-N-acetylglucosamine 1-carboxyvinyltransferase
VSASAILGAVEHGWSGTDRFVVRSCGPLSGTVRAGGAKNSALKLMAACLLAEGRHVLVDVPRITDVDIMADVLRATGATVDRLPARPGSPEPGDLVIDVPRDLHPEAPYELVERMRASVVVLGPLLARCGRARVSMPGGDDFGHRPIDMHLSGLGAMGVEFDTVHGYVEGTVVGGGPLVGAHVVLEYPSHTVTDNLLMAAALSKGTTVIDNAAREPEVLDLADALRSMGAVVRGAGTSRIEVEGAAELHPARHRVVADRVVAATFLAAAGMAGGEVVVSDARVEHMEMLVRKLRDMGLQVEHGPDGLRATHTGRIRSVDVSTLPYPGVATDYKPFLVTMLSVAEGVGIVTENLFSGRFRYVDELRRMGADIRTEGHHAVVRGVERLSGAPVRATDLRAGAALVLAGLAAEGETVVADAHHVDRGYDDFAGKLRALGADVQRV